MWVVNQANTPTAGVQVCDWSVHGEVEDVTHWVHHSQLGWICLAGEADLHPSDGVRHRRRGHLLLFLFPGNSAKNKKQNKKRKKTSDKPLACNTVWCTNTFGGVKSFNGTSLLAHDLRCVKEKEKFQGLKWHRTEVVLSEKDITYLRLKGHLLAIDG